MTWWGRWWGRGGADDVAELRARVADLEERLAFVNDRHGRLLDQEGVPMQKNATLRYELQKCQRDRLVLERHLAGCRGELRLTRGLRRRAEADPLPDAAVLADAVLFLALEARAFRLGGAGLDETEARAAALRRSVTGSDAAPDPRAVLAARAGAVLHAFEGWREPTLARHFRTADGLEALDPEVEALRAQVVDLQRQWVDPDDDVTA
jgi:hypothetical protein